MKFVANTSTATIFTETTAATATVAILLQPQLLLLHIHSPDLPCEVGKEVLQSDPGGQVYEARYLVREDLSL